MVELLLVIGCLLFSIAGGYILIIKLFDILHEEPEPGRKYRIATDDVLFLYQLKHMIDPKECIFYTGNEADVLREMNGTAVDLAVLETRPSNPSESESLKHIRAVYRPSEPAGSLELFLLSDEARSVDIYYREHMDRMVSAMLGSHFITRVN